ncbi:hypothetical protein T4D_5000 [Trichinella pseudospiralis]|uniref:Uncharacterized protein n=1 Tax=Trichinella pseudospiralis TaxID=6337 RepID=A0A0V1F4L3_TRIPS|nr:hypothetical protein T4D_5000 [Trichinella pseudospiralis]
MTRTGRLFDEYIFESLKPSSKEDFGFNHLIIPFSVDQTLLIKNASGT